jgi:hypothetical protein
VRLEASGGPAETWLPHLLIPDRYEPQLGCRPLRCRRRACADRGPRSGRRHPRDPCPDALCSPVCTGRTLPLTTSSFQQRGGLCPRPKCLVSSVSAPTSRQAPGPAYWPQPPPRPYPCQTPFNACGRHRGPTEHAVCNCILPGWADPAPAWRLPRGRGNQAQRGTGSAVVIGSQSVNCDP